MPSDSKRPCWEIYNEEMSPLNKGHALWQPAPLPYFERVQLGDVGYIREGCFNLLFSARCPPSPLKRLDIGRILQPQPQIPGCLTGNQEATVITKPSSGTPVSALEAGSSIQLRFKERGGAALVTKCQTYKENVQAVGTFNKYVKENYASWVEFAREEGHGDVNPVLVTGLDRTKDFAMMCYSNHDNGLECEFKTSTSEVASNSAWGTWQTTKFIHMNHGPQLCSPPSSVNAEDLTPPGDHRAETVSGEYNQCVFVRYFTMRTRRLGIPKVIKAGAGPHNLETGREHDDEGLLPELHSDLGWDSDSSSELDISSLYDSGGDDDEGSITSLETESDIVIHNPTSDNNDDFDMIADYVFQNSDAESVLLHHRDITPLREPGSNLDFMAQLLEKRPRIMVDENGVGVIVPQTELTAKTSPYVPAQSPQTTRNSETEGYGSWSLPWLAPPQIDIAAKTSPDVAAQSPQTTYNLETEGYGSWFLPWLALVFQKAFAARYRFVDVLNFFMVVGSLALAAYSLRVTHLNTAWLTGALECGGGVGDINWDETFQNFAAWSLPWIGLAFHIPFGGECSFEDVLNFFMTIGSPALAAYSLQITHLNTAWLNRELLDLEYPNSQAIATVISTFQHVPVRISSTGALLPSLITLPHNDAYWELLLRGVKKTRRWSIPLLVGFAWAMLSAILIVVGSFTSPASDTMGYSISAVWTYLLPLIIGWLYAGSQPEPNHLRDCLSRANQIAWVASDRKEMPLLAKNIVGRQPWAISFMEKDEVDGAREDELIAVPVFNYTRTFIWSLQAQHILSLVKRAAKKVEWNIPVDNGGPGRAVEWVVGDGPGVAPKNRLGSEEQVIKYCTGPWEFPPEKVLKTPTPSHTEPPDPILNRTSNTQASLLPVPHKTTGHSRWASGIWGRVMLAALFALGLQWGTVGPAVAIQYLQPPTGLGCRSLSFLIYGAAATASMFLCLAGSILAHISRPQHGLQYPPSRFQAYLNGATLLCTLLGKALAFIAGIGIIVICFLLSSGVHDSCCCSSMAFGRGAHDAVILAVDNVIGKKTVTTWICGLVMAFSTAGVFGLTMYLAEPRRRD